MDLKQSVRSLSMSRTRLVTLGAAIAVVLFFGWRWYGQAKKSDAPSANAHVIRVDTAAAKRADVPIYLDGLGTVQAFYTVTIKARVDGQLQKLGFTEGQALKQGALIAQIDPRPYQAALDQAIAMKAKDSAQLRGAQRDLARYVILAPQELTSQQILSEARGMEEELEAQVKADQATIDNAKTQLDYTTITAPIDGLTGIRMVDPGNIVHASDTTGIVVLTQVQPISVIFTVPEESVSAVGRALGAGALAVAAMSRDGKTELDHGTVTLIDNEIDQTTGTARLKATFPNTHNTLWPGEFVSGRLLVQTELNAMTIPSVAVQRGPAGVFTYVVMPNSTVAMRPLQIGEESGALTVVASGLAEGDTVVTSNQYRLQPGAQIRSNTATAKARPAVAVKQPLVVMGGGAQ
jgi:multidrug efflux system membrane fusion protein